MEKAVWKFALSLIIGLVIAILIGNIIDTHLHSTPIVTMLLIVYVVCGSMYILVKGFKDE